MKQICKAIINWILFLTLPVWGGVFIVTIVLIDAYENPKNCRKLWRGEKWIFEI